MCTSDVERPVRFSGLSAAEPDNDPVGFVEDGDLIASLLLALKVAQGVAALRADRIAAQFDHLGVAVAQQAAVGSIMKPEAGNTYAVRVRNPNREYPAIS